MKDRLIAILLAVITLLKLTDVLHDTDLSLPIWHLAQEWTLLLLSLAGFVYLVLDMRRRTRQQQALRASLSLSEERLRHLSDELREARRQHGAAIRQQFQEWRLSRSEQEVALLLLKGLSLKEIAAIRDTREKTVRQQASSIYGKSGLEGRHALSAWFLEDVLFTGPETSSE
ncbi:MAG: LuxR C-terminal-related transcriptional regulator [Halieaceae bacterium]|jgi:DNA-binding NarL/FixJ family response regulator|nr:LuxR C-terminal-related transcriptional regulator [Halieaceae bacterium]